MDAANRGEAALNASNYKEAITHYTTALTSSPSATTYYIKRSIAYQRTGNFEAALQDAEVAVVGAHQRAKREMIAQAQLRRGIALYNLGKYGDAAYLFDIAQKFDQKDKSFNMWIDKVRLKLKSLDDGDEGKEVTVQEIPSVRMPGSGDTKKDTGEGKGKGKDVASTHVDASHTTNSSTNGAVPAAMPSDSAAHGAQTTADKIRHEWYQNDERVYLTLLAKGVPKDKATVEIETGSVSISFPLANGSQYDFSLEPLLAAVDASSSTFRVLSTKIEVVLKKAQPGQKWAALEGTTPIPSSDAASTDPSSDAVKQAMTSSNVTASATTTGPVYPTSARGGPKNWDKIVNSYSKSNDPKSKTAKKSANDDDDESDDSGKVVDKKTTGKENDDYVDFDDEDGDDVNKFFKQLYKGASDDTRRAMVKSYQESGGTALSTNWDEVGKGPVAITPPDGMEAKKWEQ